MTLAVQATTTSTVSEASDDHQRRATATTRCEAARSDRLHASARADTIHGDAGNDSIAGERRSDELFGDDGNDSLNGGPSDDTLDGGRGRRHPRRRVERSASSATDGDDVLDGGTDNDTIAGGTPQRLALRRGAGDDTMDGQYECDLLDGGPGADSMDGGVGVSCDAVTYASRASRGLRSRSTRRERRRGSERRRVPDEGDNIVRTQRVLGGSGNDTFVGRQRFQRVLRRGRQRHARRGGRRRRAGRRTPATTRSSARMGTISSAPWRAALAPEQRLSDERRRTGHDAGAGGRRHVQGRRR